MRVQLQWQKQKNQKEAELSSPLHEPSHFSSLQNRAKKKKKSDKTDEKMHTPKAVTYYRGLHLAWGYLISLSFL